MKDVSLKEHYFDHEEEYSSMSNKEMHRKIFFTVLVLMTAAFILSPLSASHAAPAKISEESIDLLTRTGKAMAEVTAAVKPAIVNIATTRTVKIAGGGDPFFDDPFFKRFFGDQFGR